MMINTRLTKLALMLSCLGLQALPSTAMAFDSPRLFAWGLGGSVGLARGDLLIPFSSVPCRSLFYGDIQAEVGTDEAWYTGAGLGYRGMTGPSIFGGYLFVDRNESKKDLPFHHENSFDGFKREEFYVLNPGVEFFHCRGFDLRVNGYIPVSDRVKNNMMIPSF